MAGLFITFEGGEGAGKSTQVRLLSESLRNAGRTVLETREPGGSIGAEEIRNLLVQGEVDRWDEISETFLIFAARRDHFIKTIEPSLLRGDVVICDRFQDSTIAYQGFGRGVSVALLEQLNLQVTKGVVPQITILLDMPIDIALNRTATRRHAETRFELHDMEFHARIRQGFKEIAQSNPSRVFTVDASQSVEMIHSTISEELAKRFLTK